MREDPRTDSEVILYQTEDGKSRLQVRFSGETAWLSLNQLADLFQRDKSVISKHIKNIFEEEELKSEATVAKFATVQMEGGRTVSREVEFYNLDVIISVGYRVKSHRATQFRIWATQRLREFIILGAKQYHTARKSIEKLVNAGILKQVGEFSYGKTFLAEEILQAIGESAK